ncbi:armadillo-type protein [Radiomyces spectabilis]|uniref:armadillo-type protein n=1 Tax=Radiomyces spectabilis TaxID=64574 RepID=UPI0022204908|nr:armadillo-type protein [Radiomyces spectabilis]KAI8369332.1 armadillo-type protein [Radiomyces spectabilis]
MVNRPTNIESIISGVERYNPENLSALEEYLNTQCQNREYDLMANLAILKLYQFDPSLAKEQVIINILAKSLTAIPAPDFNLCLYLLSEQANLETVKQLTSLQQFLEQSRYAKFWEAYATHKQLTTNVAGFEESIRSVIANVVSMSHQVINSKVLQSYLALDGQSFNDFCAAQGWQVSGDVVTIPVNKDNEAKAVVITENIKFEQLTKVIGYSNEM